KSKDRKADTRQGQILFRSIGCLACHTVSNEGHSGPFGGGDLSKVGSKRTESWLFTWLKSPQSLNADHRMPLVKLSEIERSQLALFLSDLGDDNPKTQSSSQPLQEQVRAGKKLIEAAGCAVCHRIPGVSTKARQLADLSKSDWDSSRSCLGVRPDPKAFRPAYPQLKPAEREAIEKFIKSREGQLTKHNPLDQGRLVLEQNNCLKCHERNHTKGIVEIAGSMSVTDPSIQGQSEALIPPALNAIGDKLLDKALAEAVSGEQPKPRLPWLKVRMPKFKHSKEDKAALLHYLISQDRVPDNAPSTSTPKPSGQKTDHLVAGYTLIGAKGFSCVACHRVGSFEPRNVALGTRGSDLLMLGQRMRQSYYLRWTRSPQRIVPGMEMPSLRKAVPDVLGEDLLAQLTATWEALNDPRFTAPTSPSAVEQLLVVRPGEPTRVVRDVFTSSKENGGGYIARALAIGLNNGHNMLFDLDNFTLRNWTFGDFARQRTEGKSWYWDLAGVPIMQGFTSESDFALQAVEPSNSPLLAPIKENNSGGRLNSYQVDQKSIKIHYDLHFKIDNKNQSVHVREQITPEGSSAWKRTIAVSDVPDGYQMRIAINRRTALVGNPRIEVIGEDSTRKSEYAQVKNGAVQLLYRTDLTRPKFNLPDQPEIITEDESVTSVPGYTGTRLPLPASIMPTALTWTKQDRPGIPKGTLIFTSLKGHVFLAIDTDNDGLEDTLKLFEEGLAAPYGVLPYKNGLLVAHKPELIYLEDTNADGRADKRHVVATGWGYSDNYHDWTTSLIQDSQDRFYIGLGSDYAQPKRPKETSRWRGAVLRITPSSLPENPTAKLTPWKIEPVGQAFRYPTGLAINQEDEIFVTDNQGVQNTFNELNHLVEGRHYGVPSRHETNTTANATPPAVQVPHPWTRSVNGVFFLPPSGKEHSAFRGHGIGCEYDTRFLVRFTLQKVKGEYQGAAYYFSHPNAEAGGNNFRGPLCGAVSPQGNLYIGSIHDSGWLGGQNTGAIVRLSPREKLSNNGIREVRATPKGFEIEFLMPIVAENINSPASYDISGYTRSWKGGYATPDSSRHKLTVQKATRLPDGRTVSLEVKDRREGFVYEISCGGLSQANDRPLFPNTAHYTLHKIP
ncbi:MAG: hypothetical protein KDA84_00975, partial [Planctomycetaceae bacterium]|nr:hypothetical protein [Planctomycetaceae bacterium]